MGEGGQGPETQWTQVTVRWLPRLVQLSLVRELQELRVKTPWLGKHTSKAQTFSSQPIKMNLLLNHP